MTPEEELIAQAQATTNLVEFYRTLKENERGRQVVCKVGPSYADFDYTVYVATLRDHYLEVKIRRNKIDAYKMTKVPLRKHTFAEHSLNKDGITSFFLVQFDGGEIGLLDLSEEPDYIAEQTARTERGPYTDLYAFYDTNRLQLIHREKSLEEVLEELIPDDEPIP